ncbi:MAG TPA: NepR family anti-sigma factor [Tabrizicola sp.]|nr:NepR family anti-sigma factor [Tabrizicola sp.]
MTQNKDEDPPTRQAIRAQIDENLKRVYTTALNEELPDRFRDLLAQLKSKEPKSDSGSGSAGSGSGSLS